MLTDAANENLILHAFCHAALATLLLAGTTANAQEIENRQVVVQAEAEELPSAYGAPPDMSHGRISTLTKSYVLSPFSFELEAGYEGAVFRHGLPSQLFRQEIEMGLPARFTVGVQNQVEHFAGETRDRSFTLEARYALANWNKLPLNPAISAEYRFGLSNGLPDSGELALLISHDFPHLIEWAMNIFVDREFGGKESTSAGFAQSIEVPVLLPEEKLEVGLEMQYQSGGERIGRGGSTKGFRDRPHISVAAHEERALRCLAAHRMQRSRTRGASVRGVFLLLRRTRLRRHRNARVRTRPPERYTVPLPVR